MSTVSLSTVWATCVNRLKDKVNNRSFWEAIENTKAVAVDGDNLIIGLEADNSYYAGVINQGALQHTIASTIKEVFGRDFKFRLIDGVTIADWNSTKEREERAAAARAAAATQPTQPRTPSSAYSADWDGVYENVSRIYHETPNRTFAQGKARYASEALYALAQAMETVYPENPDDATERSLSRILDRIAQNSDLPVVMLAFELERLRAYLKAQGK